VHPGDVGARAAGGAMSSAVLVDLVVLVILIGIVIGRLIWRA
jgi:hypothetical protein